MPESISRAGDTDTIDIRDLYLYLSASTAIKALGAWIKNLENERDEDEDAEILAEIRSDRIDDLYGLGFVVAQIYADFYAGRILKKQGKDPKRKKEWEEHRHRLFATTAKKFWNLVRRSSKRSGQWETNSNINMQARDCMVPPSRWLKRSYQRWIFIHSATSTI